EDEIDTERQEHLRKEFEIYSQYKLELIEKEDPVLSSEQKKPQTKEEKREKFLKITMRFLNRMEGNKHSFWGTERYERLLNKWFPDYTLVINHKVNSIKTTIDSSLNSLNQTINEIIIKLKESVLVA